MRDQTHKNDVIQITDHMGRTALSWAMFAQILPAMCKFGTFFMNLGLGAFLMSILTMVAGWLFLEINVCIAAMFLMSLSALSFTVCMFCNVVWDKRLARRAQVKGEAKAV